MYDPSPLTDIFRSIDELRAANDALLESLPDDELETAASLSRLDDTEKIPNFIRKAAQTGAVLDLPFDRRAAQGLIDYWVSSQYLQPAGKRGLPAGQKSILLRTFDANLIDGISANAEKAFQALSPADQLIAKSFFFRLFIIRRENEQPRLASNVSLAAMHGIAKDAQVTRLLKPFEECGAIEIKHGNNGDTVQLSYDALLRRWETLRLCTEQRLKFHASALFWISNGRRGSDLMNIELVNEAKRFGDLVAVEQEYVNRSTARKRRIVWIGSGVAVSLLALLPVADQVAEAITANVINPWRATGYQAALKSTTSTAAERSQAMRWLIKHQAMEPADLTSAPLTNIDLSGLRAQGIVFGRAKLQDFNFTDASIPYAAFNNAQLERVNFTQASIEGGRFDGSTITSSKFVSSNLYLSIFDRSRLCSGVDFTEADLRSASFRGVSFDGNGIPNFSGSAWWLAHGWTADQRKKLGEQSKKVDYEKSKAFTKEATLDDGRLNAAPPDTLLRADRLNSKAWTLAIWGLRLDEAEAAARESLRIADLDNHKSEGAGVKGAVTDTLAYILLQKSQTSASSGNLMKEAALSLLETATSRYRSVLGAGFPEVLFRQAVVQIALNKSEGAASLKDAIIVLKYRPTHEMHLLANSMGENVRDELDKITQSVGSNTPQVPASSAACH